MLALLRQPSFAGSGTFIRGTSSGYWTSSRRQHRSLECPLRDRGTWRSASGDGHAAAAAHPGIPRAVILMLHTAALMQSRQLIRSRA